MSREKENQTLSSRLAESQDAVCQLKQLVENHVASEREKNKRASSDLKIQWPCPTEHRSLDITIIPFQKELNRLRFH